jgi:hypothetical protein
MLWLHVTDQLAKQSEIKNDVIVGNTNNVTFTAHGSQIPSRIYKDVSPKILVEYFGMIHHWVIRSLIVCIVDQHNITHKLMVTHIL